jgi:hypothetical protein
LAQVSTTEVGHEPTGDTPFPDPEPFTHTGGKLLVARRLLGPPWPRVLRLLIPALAFLAVREIGLLVLDWLAGRDNTTVTGALSSWDGQWFLGIAGGGYGGVPGGLADAFGRRTADTPLAFFPGYPMLVRLLTQVPGIGLLAAAFIVTLASGVVAAYGLDRLGRQVTGAPRAGLILVVLFAASPMGVVLSMTYSEATFCALAVWSLVGLLERRWLLAGLAAAGAGLVRPTAAALVLTVLIAAGIAVAAKRDGWRPWVGGLLAPLGLLGYLVAVGWLMGSPGGWFTLQREGWNSRFDFGAATVKFGLEVLADGRSVLEVGTVAILLVAIGLVVVMIRQRLPWPLIVYGALVLAIDLGSNGLMNSKARLLLPAFTLLLPPAVALAKSRRGTLITALAAIVLASAWFGGYAITGWQYAI